MQKIPEWLRNLILQGRESKWLWSVFKLVAIVAYKG
jgi:hypothetical protein